MSVCGFCIFHGFNSLGNKWSFKRFALFAVFFLFRSSVSDAQYLVDVLEKPYGSWRLVYRCEAKSANFGADLPSFSSRSNASGCASSTQPKNACSSVAKPPNNITGCTDFYAFVPRGNCAFSIKAYEVQLAEFRALIMYSNPGEPPVPMDGDQYKEEIIIPVVMVSYGCMARIMQSFPPEKGYKITIRAIPGYYDLVKYLIPFVGVVGLCFIVLFLSLLFRVCRERRRIARKRLSKRNLKKLPTKKYKKGEGLETCAICLDDFIEGEKLRILPCNHVYHCKCIDPWLTKTRKVCPICKRKVCSSGDPDSSDSETERRNAVERRDSNNRENASLIDNEMQLASTVVGANAYLDDTGSYVARSDDVEASRASTSHETNPSSAPLHSPEEPGVFGDFNPYLSAVLPVEASGFPQSSSSVSAMIRQKFRPFMQGLVDKATRSMNKSERLLNDDSQSDEFKGVDDFSAENEGFDENLEVRNRGTVFSCTRDDTGSVFTSSSLPETNDSVYFSANDQSLPLESKSVGNDGDFFSVLDVNSKAESAVNVRNAI